MRRTTQPHPQYLLQEPQSGLYLSGAQPVFLTGSAKLSKRPEAARFPTHADAALALNEIPCAAQPLEIVRVDA